MHWHNDWCGSSSKKYCTSSPYCASKHKTLAVIKRNHQSIPENLEHSPKLSSGFRALSKTFLSIVKSLLQCSSEEKQLQFRLSAKQNESYLWYQYREKGTVVITVSDYRLVHNTWKSFWYAPKHALQVVKICIQRWCSCHSHNQNMSKFFLMS